MTKKNKILTSVLVFFVLGIIGFVSVGGTSSGRQGNLLGVNRGQSNVTVYVDGIKIKSFRATDLSKNLRPILKAIDKRYGVNMAGQRGGLFDGINSIASRGIIPGNLIQGGNIYINGSNNPFGSEPSTIGQDGMGLGMVEGFRDSSGFVASDGSNVDENGNPIKIDPKTGEPYTASNTGTSTSSTSENPFGNIQLRRDGGNTNSGSTTSGSTTSGSTTSGSTTSGSTTSNEDDNPFSNIQLRRSENPNNDSAYGTPTVGDLMVNITTKNEALGAGTVKRPDSLDDFNELANPNYGVSNPGENGDSTINPGSLAGVIVTLDCARTSGDTYCGSNTRVNVQVVIVPNPQGGVVGGNPTR